MNAPPPWHLADEPAADAVLRLPAGMRDKLRLTKTIFLDVDGVLTDASRVLGLTGQAVMSFNARDGLGICLVQSAGIKVIFVSAIQSSIVALRAKELGVEEIWLGHTDKLRSIRQAEGQFGRSYIYVGDDIWDLAAMEYCDVGVAVGDALPDVRRAAQIVTFNGGGRGAVREVCDLTLAAKGLNVVDLLAAVK